MLVVLKQAWLFVMITVLQIWLLLRIALLCTIYFSYDTSVLKEAKERHAIKEVKDAIIKGNILETVCILFTFTPKICVIFHNVLITNIN